MKDRDGDIKGLFVGSAARGDGGVWPSVLWVRAVILSVKFESFDD